LNNTANESICKKKYFEKINYTGGFFLPLREYPVTKILTVNLYGNGEILEPEFYNSLPDLGTDYDLPFSIELSPALLRFKGLKAIKVIYFSGYNKGAAPADLASACLELASWNFNRYKGKRIGMTGNIKGAGKEGEHFEMSIPENVKALLEPYKRKVI
jgi:hypothetical protein